MSLSEHSVNHWTSPSHTINGSRSFEGGTHGMDALPVNTYPQSPYADSNPFYLDIGPNKKRYLIHRTILSQSPKLAINKSNTVLWGERASDSLSLPDLDEKTGHTVVHYLYTGTYQTLEPFEPPSTSVNPNQVQRPDGSNDNSNAIVSYKLGTSVYCAATRYLLPGLASLAQLQIRSLSSHLGIIDILSVAREHAFPRLPKDGETWYALFINEALKHAVLEDPELFTKTAFIEQIGGDTRFKQVLVGAMLSHARGTSSVSERQTELSTPVTEARNDSRGDRLGSSSWEGTVQGSTLEEVPEQDLVGADESVGEDSEGAAPEPLTTIVAATRDDAGREPQPQQLQTSGEAESIKLDEIEPSAPSHVEPEPFTDECGFANSRTYQNQRQRKPSESQDSHLNSNEQAKEEVVVPDTVTKKALHKRADSAVEVVTPVEQVTMALKESAVASPEASPEVAPVIAEPTTPISKKARKRQQKKKNSMGFS